MLQKANKTVQLKKEKKKAEEYRAYHIESTGLDYRDKLRRKLVEILKAA